MYDTDVKRIGIWSFARCKIKEVIIPKTVYSIGCGAFWRCGIEKIELGPSITEIGFTAFSGTYKLKRLDLTKTKIKNFPGFDHPYSIQQLGVGEASGVEEILFPDGFKYIYDYSYAFHSVKRWTYQKNVNYLQYEFLSNSLENLYSDNENVAIINGSAFLCDKNRHPSILLRSTSNANFNFTSKISKIGRNAFSGLNISKLSFQFDIDEINSESFSYCNIETFVIPHLPKNGFNIRCASLLLTSNAKSADEIKSIKRVTNIYYCGTSLLNATGEENQNKFTTNRYKHEYFLKSNNFSRSFHSSLCNTPEYHSFKDYCYFFDVMAAILLPILQYSSILIV